VCILSSCIIKYALNKLIGTVATMAPTSVDKLLDIYFIKAENNPPKIKTKRYSVVIILYIKNERNKNIL
jgi:hypothetical protein